MRIDNPQGPMYMIAIFDVSGLDEAERAVLAGEVGVQAEATDRWDEDTPGKPDVPYPTIAWSEDTAGFVPPEEVSVPDPNAEKIERSRENAAAALEAYRDRGGQEMEDDLTAISDLIGDLMHLADKAGEECEMGEGVNDRTWGDYVVRRAIDYGYDPERMGE